MNELKEFNKYIFDKYKNLRNIDNLSSPNLVSSKIFNEKIEKHPILYIGQETNGWINYDKDINEITLDIIEDTYDFFLIQKHTTKSIFWRFLKNCLNDNYQNFYKNVVWCNTLLCGKRYGKGTPDIDENLKQLSLENLLFIYNFFKPRAIINVSGNSNPYYDINKYFFKEIKSSLLDSYPTDNNPLLIDYEKNIFWAYHPMRLYYTNNFDLVSSKINKQLKKGSF